MDLLQNEDKCVWHKVKNMKDFLSSPCEALFLLPSVLFFAGKACFITCRRSFKAKGLLFISH